MKLVFLQAPAGNFEGKWSLPSNLCLHSDTPEVHDLTDKLGAVIAEQYLILLASRLAQSKLKFDSDSHLFARFLRRNDHSSRELSR